MRNTIKTTLLLGTMFTILFLIGKTISLSTGNAIFTYIFMIIGLGSIFYTYWNSATLALKSMNAYEITPQTHPQIHRIIDELSQKAQQPKPKLYISPSMTPNAFATGRNPKNAAVCCTQGILQLLDERELKAVLAHELMHVYNKDILTSTIATAIASIITSLSYLAMFSPRNNEENHNPLASILIVIFTPILATILQLAVSRTREYEADHDGALLCQDPLALASALKKLEEGINQNPLPNTQQTQNLAHMMISNPFGSHTLKNLMSTHPATKDRVKELEKIAGYH